VTAPLTVGDPPLTFSRWVAGVVARWKTVLLTLLVTGLLAVLAVLFIPAVYQARASFVTNPSSGGIKLPASISGGGALGGIASQLGLGATADPTESPDFYSELIRSRELRTRLLNSRFDDPRTATPGDSVRLLELLKIRNTDPQRRVEIGLKRLDQAIDVSFFDKTNLVKLKVNSQWPRLSADVANRTLDLVSQFNREQRTSRARSNRTFLESRVRRARTELDDAEARHRNFYDQNRSWKTSPALVFREQQLQRDVDRTAELYLLLERQLETALLEENNDAALITVVDSAVAPRKAQWPRYGLLLMSVVIGGTLLGIMLAGGATVLADWRVRNPSSALHLGGTMRNVTREIGGAFRRSPSPKAPSQRRVS
jgi:uncharacterized protein involved in exopolysaccharide biosynthesis